jgi:hypothetical protein
MKLISRRDFLKFGGDVQKQSMPMTIFSGMLLLSVTGLLIVSSCTRERGRYANQMQRLSPL